MWTRHELCVGGASGVREEPLSRVEPSFLEATNGCEEFGVLARTRPV